MDQDHQQSLSVVSPLLLEVQGRTVFVVSHSRLIDALLHSCHRRHPFADAGLDKRFSGCDQQT